MYKWLYTFLEMHEILYTLQFGFCDTHSINHALVILTVAIKCPLDNRKYSCGIFIDLQKAFDTLNHNAPLLKLEHYRIRGNALDWSRSYLTARKRYVSVNVSNSNYLNATYGLHRDLLLVPSFSYLDLLQTVVNKDFKKVKNMA